MKKLFFLALIVISAKAFSEPISDLSKIYISAGDTLKVILGVNHNDKYASDNLRTALKSINGTTIVAYCDNHSLFMLLIDKTILRDRNDLMNELKKKYPKAEDQLSFKDGDFNAFIQYCTPSNVDDAANLKKLITN